MMSQRSKRELVKVIRPRYLKASRREKTTIIDEFIAATNYHRKHVIVCSGEVIQPRESRKAGDGRNIKGNHPGADSDLGDLRAHCRCGNISKVFPLLFR